MTEINNSKVKLFSRYHSKLSQLRHLIDETKKEQSVKNLEAKRLHDEQADVLLEHWLSQQVNEQLKSIGLNNLSKYKQFDRSLDEVIVDLLSNENSKLEIIELIITTLSESLATKVYFIPWHPLLISLFSLISNYCNDERQAIFKISNFLLSEDAQSVLEVLITRESKNARSPIIKKMVMLHLFFDIFWGNRIVPYFQNKVLINTKEID
jgi:hypothetical protein